MAVDWHTAGHGEKMKVAASLLILLSLHVLYATASSSAQSSVTAIRGLLDPADMPRAIAVDLMHAHHVESPYMQGRRKLTMTERVQLSVENSKRRLQSAHDFTSPVNRAYYGEYTMQITVGTPARTFVAIADTGSDLVWLQCTNSTCTDKHCISIPDKPFDPTSSSSYSPVPCNSVGCGFLALANSELTCPSTGICAYNYSYSDGTFASGELAGETFTLTSSDGSKTLVSGIEMGCGTDDESTNTFGTDGLVGLGQGSLSLVTQLASQSIISQVFSYCLVDFSAATTQTSPLLLGSTGAVPKAYTPLIATNSYVVSSYYVNLVGITVNGEAISYPAGTFEYNITTGGGGMYVDSGTQYTELVDAALSPFESAISKLVTYPAVNGSADTFGLDLCYNTSNVSSPVFPTVVFQFENVDVTLGVNNTFVPVENGTVYCLAFQNSGTTSPSVYGNVQQSHFEISFDVENHRIGFGPNAC